ncbi:hypothetical protein BO82DRAFT_399818 [Aspergillus uvarum CBS 121591]|uniref:Uncharacterized protein n=1 Tax=Aspergillus uvarum CBS 121591 TaxID=1448315 RepID=A0A319CI77_9EURO|nr:hypothetical protein BO82DRAFT_399818 [Aspergillus uvarum CBS 121591]PYH84160.1 hypothetical protein BO82DRAFT_399818 [Aspergillus uvarum CBS 121591]
MLCIIVATYSARISSVSPWEDTRRTSTVSVAHAHLNACHRSQTHSAAAKGQPSRAPRFNIVTGFLASPASVTPNLPMFSYTSVGYGLLVLSKLSLLSDTATKGQAVDVHPKDIHNLGLAAMQRMEATSRGKMTSGIIAAQ